VLEGLAVHRAFLGDDRAGGAGAYDENIVHEAGDPSGMEVGREWKWGRNGSGAGMEVGQEWEGSGNRIEAATGTRHLGHSMPLR
jgi:hypothetical protein